MAFGTRLMYFFHRCVMRRQATHSDKGVLRPVKKRGFEGSYIEAECESCTTQSLATRTTSWVGRVGSIRTKKWIVS
ncbi:hypothetical protein EUGRSUZ_J01989 [Eucalyptus grandis]|uniref:Uncharacterized protein n=2 Tax=Eucalyptus grandis TaxID=71139 RepID=A0ACC3J7E1_EUCGR|nr:hypothetical protein EUGRSUZ_J01989 [Eucalyptus grandis]